MRTVWSVLILVALLAGCRNENGTPPERQVADKNESAGVPAAENRGLGKMITRLYEGECSSSETDSCAHYALTVESHEHSGDGTFRLEISARKSGGDAVYLGKRYTLRGMDGDDDATVWQFAADGGERFNFKYDMEEDSLVLLGDNCERIDAICILKRSK